MKEAPTILDAEPQLFVSDLTGALGFFVEMLGFAVAFTHGEPAFYAQVVRDGARINLRHVEGPVFAPDFRAREADPLAVTLTVGGIEALFDEYRSRGVPFHQGLRTEPWGARTFIVHGPDANLLAFAGRQ
jgi:catechol 2,3-dioxygenase-like lactoylglutathione lyase family enzyme